MPRRKIVLLTNLKGLREQLSFGANSSISFVLRIQSSLFKGWTIKKKDRGVKKIQKKNHASQNAQKKFLQTENKGKEFLHKEILPSN